MASSGIARGSTELRMSALLLGLFLLGGCAGTVGKTDPGDGPLLPAQIPGQVEAPDVAVARGHELLAAHRYSEAQRVFANVLRSQPDNFEARLGAAEASLGAGNLIEALAGFESVMEAPDLRSLALQGRGISLSLIGRRAMGQDLLTQAVKLDPTLWRAWNAIGCNQSRAGRPDLALESYGRALQLNPSAAALHNNLGLALVMRGRHEEAEAAFRTALHIDPESSPAQMNLRLSVASQGRYGAAVAGVEPGQLPAVMNNVGYMALQRGDLDVARSYFVKAMESSPSFYQKAARNLEYVEEIKKSAAPPAAQKN